MARAPQGMLGTPHPPPREAGGRGDGPARRRGGTTPHPPNPGARCGPASSRDWPVQLNKAASPREGREDFQEVLEGGVCSRACAPAAPPLKGAARGAVRGGAAGGGFPWGGATAPALPRDVSSCGRKSLRGRLPGGGGRLARMAVTGRP